GAFLRQLHHPAVIQLAALGREIDHPARASRGFHSVQRSFYRLGQHHHAGPAAVRTVIDRPVVVRREVARVPGLQRPQARLQRAAGNPALRHRCEHLGEDRDRVETDHQSTPHSTTILRSPRFTSFTTVGTHGNSRVLPAASSSITSCAPLVNSFFTVPSGSPASFTTSRPTRSAR